MEEFIVSNDELKQLFKDKKMIDSGKGWLYEGKEIEISAIHEIEPKYMLDKAKSEQYRITPKKK
ncbi:MAG: hypothetical protein U9Q20_00455 [Campylobacterota bacterium]|nr:hypothetical protein [Campylobacterota bacterium]